MPDTKRLVAQATIDKLFKGHHFDICAVRELIEMTGAQRDSEAMRLLKPLHCMSWSDMPRDLRDRVPLLVREALATNQWAQQASAVVATVLDPLP